MNMITVFVITRHNLLWSRHVALLQSNHTRMVATHHMASTSTVQCLVCPKWPIPTERRRLEGPSAELIIPVLTELLPEAGRAKLRDAQCCICRSCYRSVEKLIKLRQDTQKKEKELAMQVPNGFVVSLED